MQSLDNNWIIENIHNKLVEVQISNMLPSNYTPEMQPFASLTFFFKLIGKKHMHCCCNWMNIQVALKSEITTFYTA